MGHDGGDSVVTEARLRELYTERLSTRRPPARTACPSPEALQALVRREGTEEERLRTLDHVMSCADCRAELRSAPEHRGGRSPGGGDGRASRKAWMMPAALAATLLVAVGIGRLALRPSDEELVRAGSERGR